MSEPLDPYPDGKPPGYLGPERRRGYPPASQDEVADMRMSQEALDRSVRGLHSQLRSLDAALRDYVPRREREQSFPTKRDLELEKGIASNRRRVIAEASALAVIGTIMAHDVHVEQCRPLNADGRVDRPEGITATICDVSFPLHSHTPGAVDSSGAHTFGLFLWAVIIAVLVTDLARNKREARKREAQEREHPMAAGS